MDSRRVKMTAQRVSSCGYQFNVKRRIGLDLN